jgi:hypothetical protein
MIRDLMIAAASVEDTLTLFASSLRDAKWRIRPLFAQERGLGVAVSRRIVGQRAGQERLNAGAAGDPGPWRQQAILGRAQWDADALRDREYALETLGDDDAVLVIEVTGF